MRRARLSQHARSASPPNTRMRRGLVGQRVSMNGRKDPPPAASRTAEHNSNDRPPRAIKPGPLGTWMGELIPGPDTAYHGRNGTSATAASHQPAHPPSWPQRERVAHPVRAIAHLKFVRHPIHHPIAPCHLPTTGQRLNDGNGSLAEIRQLLAETRAINAKLLMPQWNAELLGQGPRQHHGQTSACETSRSVATATG